MPSPINSSAPARFVFDNNRASSGTSESADAPQLEKLTLQPHGFQKLPGSLLTLNGMLSVPDIGQVKPVDKFLNDGLSGRNVHPTLAAAIEAGQTVKTLETFTEVAGRLADARPDNRDYQSKKYKWNENLSLGRFNLRMARSAALRADRTRPIEAARRQQLSELAQELRKTPESPDALGSAQSLLRKCWKHEQAFLAQKHYIAFSRKHRQDFDVAAYRVLMDQHYLAYGAIATIKLMDELFKAFEKSFTFTPARTLAIRSAFEPVRLRTGVLFNREDAMAQRNLRDALQTGDALLIAVATWEAGQMDSANLNALSPIVAAGLFMFLVDLRAVMKTDKVSQALTAMDMDMDMDHAGLDHVRDQLLLDPLVLCRPNQSMRDSLPWQHLEEACGTFEELAALPFDFTFKDMSDEEIVRRGGLPPFDFA